MELICSICEESYDKKQRKPLVFLCGHTFCKRCISDYFDKHRVIQCFLDRREFSEAIYKSIDDIGTNFEILDKLDIKPIRQVEEDKNNDNQCKLHPKKNLDWFCLTDNMKICSLCRKQHEGHKILDEE